MTAALLILRQYWKLIGLGLLLMLLGVQTIRLGNRSNQLEREKINSNELRAELKAISDAKDKQGETTKGNIGKAEQGRREADKRAEKIERAPPTKDCDTPPEILGADL